jgi:hypothetical protein
MITPDRQLTTANRQPPTIIILYTNIQDIKLQLLISVIYLMKPKEFGPGTGEEIWLSIGFKNQSTYKSYFKWHYSVCRMKIRSYVLNIK